MTPSLQALLAGAIDYAGMFPPASLDLEQSARNYFAYGAAPEAWMLGRFVCPASRLHELASIAETQRRSHQTLRVLLFERADLIMRRHEIRSCTL